MSAEPIPERLRTAETLDTALAWDILKELGNAERHFNNLEAEYRKLASIWLLAGFAGIGFLLKQEAPMAIPREVAVAGLGVATSIGILLLWIVDLLVYHRLLDGCFSEAKRIEAAHPELPQVRLGMGNILGGGKVVTYRLRWFYIVLTAAPVVFAAPLFVVWCAQRFGPAAAAAATAIWVLYLAMTSRMIWTDSLNLKKG